MLPPLVATTNHVTCVCESSIPFESIVGHWKDGCDVAQSNSLIAHCHQLPRTQLLSAMNPMRFAAETRGVYRNLLRAARETFHGEQLPTRIDAWPLLRS